MEERRDGSGTDKTKTVYLLGGTGAISDAEETQIKAMGYVVKRISGADRFATSVAIANEINPHPTMATRTSSTLRDLPA